MYGPLTDIPNSSGVLVTTIGYQSGVEKYANFYGMGLKLLRLPKTEDWDGGIQIINIDMQLLKNTYIDLHCDYDGNGQMEVAGEMTLWGKISSLAA